MVPFLRSSIGRKIVMAVTGFFMLCFIFIHLIGNSTIYVGWLNAYAEHLHALPPLVWAFRAVMLALFGVHVYLGVQLALENNDSKPSSYAIRTSLRTTFAAKNMIWTGILIAVFLVYHILHFTLHITNPSISSGVDALGRPDVFKMVLLSFQQAGIAAVYVLALVVLALHLSHGIQSLFQSAGLNSERSIDIMVKAGTVVAIVLFIGYVSIPIVILVGILKG